MNETASASPLQSSPRLLLAFAAVSGLAVLVYLGIGVGLHLRQTRLEHRIVHLQPGTSREAVLRSFGTPAHRTPDDSEWLYVHSSSAFELPITPMYPALFVQFSPAGTVTATGVSRD
jgi:outer membrane protein assembly factor BamE (lipoprotein component of BamABCDE complex)